jgi:hypothetical protein
MEFIPLQSRRQLARQLRQQRGEEEEEEEEESPPLSPALHVKFLPLSSPLPIPLSLERPLTAHHLARVFWEREAREKERRKEKWRRRRQEMRDRWMREDERDRRQLECASEICDWACAIFLLTMMSFFFVFLMIILPQVAKRYEYE